MQWDNISVAIMQNGDNGDEIIDLQVQQAISEGRLPVANSNPLITSVISQEFDTLASNFSLSTILGGRYYTLNTNYTSHCYPLVFIEATCILLIKMPIIEILLMQR